MRGAKAVANRNRLTKMATFNPQHITRREAEQLFHNESGFYALTVSEPYNVNGATGYTLRDSTGTEHHVIYVRQSENRTLVQIR